MRGAAILVSAISLSVATATTIFALGIALTDEQVIATPAEVDSAPVHAFVTAITDAVQTGNESTLDAVLSADFVDHAPTPPGRGRDELLRRLRMLHASFTELSV